MATTQPGGYYIVGGKPVDSEGRPVKERRPPTPEAGELDISNASKDQLIAEAERRGVKVERADGKEGDPTVADYRAALRG